MGRRRKVLVALAAGALVASVGASWSVQAQPLQTRSAPSAQATAYAIVGAVRLPTGNASAVAISNDDTVYASTGGSNYVGIINPRRIQGLIDDSIPADFPTGLAVRSDDTLYVLEYNQQRISAFRPDRSSAGSLGLNAYYDALSLGGDDTLVASVNGQNKTTFIKTDGLALSSTVTSAGVSESGAFDSQKRFVTGIRGVGLATFSNDGQSVLSTIATSGRPIETVINSDDTKFVAIYEQVGEVRVAAPGGVSIAYSVPVNKLPRALALDTAGNVIVGSYDRKTLQLIGRNSSTSDTIITGLASPTDLAITSTGLIYVAQAVVSRVAVVAPVSAALAVSAGPVGSPLGVNVTGLPAGALMDDSAVKAVWWGDDTIPFARTGGANAVSVTVPPGSENTPIVLQLNGGNAVTAGTFVYTVTPPAPAPPTPSTPPRDIAAIPGDTSAEISWSAPVSSGSYPVSHYRATSSPGGRTCLVAAPALSCEVQGLTNGTAYTFTVAALTGAGWSAASDPSNAVTPETAPRPSVMITGSREGDRIKVTGSTTGFGLGGTLRPWLRFAGQSTYSEGSATILVSMDGTLEWGRRTGKRVSVYVQTPDAVVRSNTVAIPAP